MTPPTLDRRMRLISTPGRIAPAGEPPRPVMHRSPLTGHVKADIITFADKTQLALWSDGSLRHIHPRRPKGVSGRQRRINRKLGMRVMRYRLAHGMPLAVPSSADGNS